MLKDWKAELERVPDYRALGDLTGRVAVVVGAGHGLGGHTAHALSAYGAQVAVVDRRADLAAELAREVGGVPIQADVTRSEDVDRVLAETVGGLGRADVLVDIVGIGRFGSLMDFTDQDWSDSYDVNFRHVALFTRTFGKHFCAQQSGSMVFIGSISGLVSAGNHAAYGAFKSAVHSLVRSAAVEFAPHGVRVNAVAPGLTATPRVVETLPDADLVGRLGGLTRSQDIAAAAYFLASDLAAMVNGQTLVVDGGQTLRYPIELPSKVVSGQAASGAQAAASER